MWTNRHDRQFEDTALSSFSSRWGFPNSGVYQVRLPFRTAERHTPNAPGIALPTVLPCGPAIELPQALPKAPPA